MSSTDLELCYLSATDILKRFRACTLSPVEYLTELIKRAEETEPVINAFAFTWFDQAMDLAKKAEQKYARKDPNIRACVDHGTIVNRCQQRENNVL